MGGIGSILPNCAKCWPAVKAGTEMQQLYLDNEAYMCLPLQKTLPGESWQ